jgi:tetratricopeptide (TPR) repeat protein
MFKRLGCEVNVLRSPRDDEEPKHDLVVEVNYQGGHFVGVVDVTDNGACLLTITFSRCFSVKAESMLELQEAVNAVNMYVCPCKCTYDVDDEDGEVFASIYCSGLFISEEQSYVDHLRTILNSCFWMQRMLHDRMKEFEMPRLHPGDTSIRNRIVFGRVNRHQAEINGDYDYDNYSCLEVLQDETLETMIHKTLGYELRPGFLLTDSKQLQYEPDVEKIKSFRLLDVMYNNFNSCERQLLYAGGPDEDIEPNVRSLVVWGERSEPECDVNQTAIVTITVQASGLRATTYRDFDSPEREPRWHRIQVQVICEDMGQRRAEGVYMAAEQGLVDVLKEPEDAYNIYWGKTLFASDRYYEALNYLLPAWKSIAPKVRESEAGSELTEIFYEASFFIGCCFNALNLPERAAYYLDILIGLNRIPFTKEYIMSLMKLDDPRVDAIISNTRRSVLRARDDGSIADENENFIEDFLLFLHCQEIILDIRAKRTEKARKALQKILEDDPNNAFALKWLAKLG